MFNSRKAKKMYPVPYSETHPEKLEELLSLRCAQRMELGIVLL